MKITKEIKEKIIHYILSRYDGSRDVIIHRDGSVTVWGYYGLDDNGCTQGRFFCGWTDDLLHEIEIE